MTPATHRRPRPARRDRAFARLLDAVRVGDPRVADLRRAYLREFAPSADDTGEAAANYFILKLMGYPDVKVLAL